MAALKEMDICVHIKPETKNLAESILETNGLTVSKAINLFFEQIILHNGLPFSYPKPLDVTNLSEEEFVNEIKKGYDCAERGDLLSVEEAFSF